MLGAKIMKLVGEIETTFLPPVAFSRNLFFAFVVSISNSATIMSDKTGKIVHTI